MVLKERRSVDMYSEGSVRQYESVRCSATSYEDIPCQLIPASQHPGRAEGKADSIPELLYSEKHVSQTRMMGK